MYATRFITTFILFHYTRLKLMEKIQMIICWLDHRFHINKSFNFWTVFSILFMVVSDYGYSCIMTNDNRPYIHLYIKTCRHFGVSFSLSSSQSLHVYAFSLIRIKIWRFKRFTFISSHFVYFVETVLFLF